MRTAIAEVIGPNSARRCLAMVFTLNSQRIDLDPCIQQVVRKVLLLRRVTAKYPKLTTTAKAALCAYTQQGKAGTTITLTADQTNQPHMGPIGHILTALHHIGIHIDPDFNLTYDQHTQTSTSSKHKHTIINIINIPWQHLASQIEHLAKEARFTNEVSKRQHLQPATGIDYPTLKASLRLQPPNHHNILQQLGTGAGWVGRNLEKLAKGPTTGAYYVANRKKMPSMACGDAHQ